MIPDTLRETMVNKLATIFDTSKDTNNEHKKHKTKKTKSTSNKNHTKNTNNKKHAKNTKNKEHTKNAKNTKNTKNETKNETKTETKNETKNKTKNDTSTGNAERHKILAKIIEQSVFDFFQLWVQNHPKTKKLKNVLCRNLYTSKMRQVYHFLKEDSYIQYNNRKLLRNENELKKIAFMHYTVLCPTKWNLLEEDLAILDKKILNDEENIQTTDAFRCPRCKQTKCIYSEVQTRSCDENATIFVRCMNCGNCFRG